MSQSEELLRDMQKGLLQWYDFTACLSAHKINIRFNGNMSVFVILCKLTGRYYQNTDGCGEQVKHG